MTTPLKNAAEVAEHIATLLGQVRTANGAETDIGRQVFRGRHNIDKDVVPCCVIFEGPDNPTDQPGRSQLTNVMVTPRYVLAAYVPCNPDNPNDAAHAAVRDIKRAMFRDEGVGTSSFGGRVRKVTYKGRDIGPRADGQPIVFVTVDIIVEFSEDLANP